MNTRNLLVIVLGVLALFIMAAVVAVAVAVPEGANPGSLIVILLGTLTTVVTSLLAVAGVADVNRKVDHLSNGLMDRKIVRGVHVALDQRDPNLPDPPTEEPHP